MSVGVIHADIESNGHTKLANQNYKLIHPLVCTWEWGKYILLKTETDCMLVKHVNKTDVNKFHNKTDREGRGKDTSSDTRCKYTPINIFRAF